MSALALAFTFASCDKGGKDPIDLDNVTEDGFYLAGPATGASAISAEYMMTAGVNEVLMDPEGEYKLSWSESKRAGMYEKYIVLEGGKDFELVLYANGEQLRYSAELADYDTKELKNNPTADYGMLKRGSLVTGADAPTMKVEKTGLYHIVLDLNEGNDLPFGAQIVVAPVTWGVRGDMNGWGFTPFPEPAKYSNDGITWVLEDQKLGVGGSFKFAYNHAWKINLDDAEKVKAHTNLGKDMQNGGDNISVDKGGLYKITLTYKLATGDISASYDSNAELTQASSLPSEMFMIGQNFGEWNWESAGVRSLTPVNGAEGHFWTVVYLAAQEGVKLATEKKWDAAFGKLLTNEGGFQNDKDGNAFVAEAGLYLIYADMENSKMSITPAVLCGLGDAFGGWDSTSAGQVVMTVANDGKASVVATANGLLRSFVKIDGIDAWKVEFSVLNGNIVYRGNGGDFNDTTAATVSAGQTITYDFNANTATIQ